MTREATQLEKHEWYIAYGLILCGFITGYDERGIIHWMAEAYEPEGTRIVLINVCTMIQGEKGWQLPDEEVSCMACVAQSCRPLMLGEIS